MTSENYYPFALFFAAVGIIIAIKAFKANRKSAANSGRSADQVEKAHTTKYEISLEADFRLCDATSEGYRSEVDVRNGGEIPVTIAVDYKGHIDLFPDCTNRAGIWSSLERATIKPGETATLEIELLTAGAAGRAKFDIQCVATNSGHREGKKLTLATVDEILRKHH
ncbi:hypothetical protein [Pseudomonas sp. FP1742]|uniref:hypothetical protein n=1 Tax=Pseudomonas sp. FP1742 TaxID=2954079 RepID=UPI002733395F|nr:hypothetical protein [Pseudomonas sp. FP1742]WLG52552.1 hypothetical protein PSH64_08550 [Pseudomonas sp. FP1742]